MISDLGALITWTREVFALEFSLYGFSFSLWQVFLFHIVAGIVAFLLLLFSLGVR